MAPHIGPYSNPQNIIWQKALGRCDEVKAHAMGKLSQNIWLSSMQSQRLFVIRKQVEVQRGQIEVKQLVTKECQQLLEAGGSKEWILPWNLQREQCCQHLV